MRQLVLPFGHGPEPTFDSFLVHGGNAAAVEHLRTFDGRDGPAYLWGPPGAGKSHLLAAVAARCRAEGGSVGCFGCERPLPWPFDPAWSLVLLDDCDMLDDERQHQAFVLFVEARIRGTPFAAAGRVPPVDLPLREDLRTRLAWGPVFALEPLPEDQLRDVLREAARQRGIMLSADVVEHLLTRFARDLGHLMPLLDRLDRFALAEKRAVTVPLLKKMLHDEEEAS